MEEEVKWSFSWLLFNRGVSVGTVRVKEQRRTVGVKVTIRVFSRVECMGIRDSAASDNSIGSDCVKATLPSKVQ